MVNKSSHLIIFVVYSILYQALIWGIFAWAVFIKNADWLWLILAWVLSSEQYGPDHFGIKSVQENDENSLHDD